MESLRHYDAILNLLQRRPLSESECLTLLAQVAEFGEVESAFEMFKSSGIPLEIAHHHIYYRPSLTPITKETFCIVDIETNGHDPKKHTPIEIGAVKFCNGRVVECFESFVFSTEIPDGVTALTGISVEMLKDAPSLSKVLESFKLFLSDSIFVAHNVAFDFHFLSHCMNNCGYGYLYNPTLCTIKLAERTLQAPRYSLSFLNTFLNINHTNLHRALQDSKTALEIFKLALKNLPTHLYTSKDLLEFMENPL